MHVSTGLARAFSTRPIGRSPCRKRRQTPSEADGRRLPPAERLPGRPASRRAADHRAKKARAAMGGSSSRAASGWFQIDFEPPSTGFPVIPDRSRAALEQLFRASRAPPGGSRAASRRSERSPEPPSICPRSISDRSRAAPELPSDDWNGRRSRSRPAIGCVARSPGAAAKLPSSAWNRRRSQAHRTSGGAAAHPGPVDLEGA